MPAETHFLNFKITKTVKPFYALLFALTPPQCFAQGVRFSYDNNGNRIHREWVAERIGEDNSPKALHLQFSSEPSDENAFNVVVDNRRNCLDVLEKTLKCKT